MARSHMHLTNPCQPLCTCQLDHDTDIQSWPIFFSRRWTIAISLSRRLLNMPPRTVEVLKIPHIGTLLKLASLCPRQIKPHKYLLLIAPPLPSHVPVTISTSVGTCGDVLYKRITIDMSKRCFTSMPLSEKLTIYSCISTCSTVQRINRHQYLSCNICS